MLSKVERKFLRCLTTEGLTVVGVSLAILLFITYPRSIQQNATLQYQTYRDVMVYDNDMRCARIVRRRLPGSSDSQDQIDYLKCLLEAFQDEDSDKTGYANKETFVGLLTHIGSSIDNIKDWTSENSTTATLGKIPKVFIIYLHLMN